MTESTTTGRATGSGFAGEDFVCRACGCEVTVRHWGEPSSHADRGTFVCHCGQQMAPEHPSHGSRSGEGGSGFDQQDFLGHGGGVDETGDAAGRSSPGANPGGER